MHSFVGLIAVIIEWSVALYVLYCNISKSIWVLLFNTHKHTHIYSCISNDHKNNVLRGEHLKCIKEREYVKNNEK